jgi:hypothetical protein
MIRLPFTIPFMAPSMMTYGERKFMVIGKVKNAKIMIALRIR